MLRTPISLAKNAVNTQITELDACIVRLGSMNVYIYKHLYFRLFKNMGSGTGGGSGEGALVLSFCYVCLSKATSYIGSAEAGRGGDYLIREVQCIAFAEFQK